MSGNNFYLGSDSKVETSLGWSTNSPHPSFSSDHIWLEIILIFYNLELERMSKTSFKEETSPELLEAFISNVGGIMIRVEVHMPPRVLSEDEASANWKGGDFPKILFGFAFILLDVNLMTLRC